MHLWTFKVLHMLSFALLKHKVRLYEKSHKIYFSFAFDLNIRNTDYVSSHSFPGFTEGAPMFFLEAEFCSPQRGQLCGLKEAAEITALGSCWNIRRNPQRLLFQVRVARPIEQIHFSATDTDVLSLSWRLWHRLISYCNSNATTANTLPASSTLCTVADQKNKLPLHKKIIILSELAWHSYFWNTLQKVGKTSQKYSHVSLVLSTSFQWGSFPLPLTQKRTSGATGHNSGRGDQGGQTWPCRLSHLLKHQSYWETMQWIPMTLIPAADNITGVPFPLCFSPHLWSQKIGGRNGERGNTKKKTQAGWGAQTGFFLVHILDFPFPLTLTANKYRQYCAKLLLWWKSEPVALQSTPRYIK